MSEQAAIAVVERLTERLRRRDETIAELQKRIGGLEAGHNQHSLAMHDKLMRALEQKECAQIALTAERQRRKDAETIVRRIPRATAIELARLHGDHFSRYPSES